ALVRWLGEKLDGAVVAEIEPASFAVLKTYDPTVSAFAGLTVSGVRRHGKFIDIDVDGLHLVIHLAKAGWLRWSDRLGEARVKMGGLVALRLRVDRGEGPHEGFDLTEAGTRKRLAVYAVRDPQEVAGIERLGPDPLEPGFELRPLLQ